MLTHGLLLSLLGALSWIPCASADAVSDLSTKGKANFEAQLAKSTTCSKKDLRIRREWGSLNTTERKAYISAVQCLMESPTKLNQTRYPGARTRFDDFVAVHMNQSLSIHGTGNFLSWHRYFTWAWEEVLRNECDYEGTQPYWDTGLWAEDPAASPIFDGSDTSMGGNGEKVPHSSNGIKPAGDGGGCVQSGPFKNMTVNFGPVANADTPAPPRNPRADGFGYNPRCLRRDISNYLTQKYAKTSDIVNLITNYTTIGAFQDKFQAPDGIHGASHFTISGDPGGDFYTSPGDPAFWLLHAQIDRIWHIWQTQDYANRQQVIAGGINMWGSPGRAQSLEDPVDLDVVADEVLKIKELMSTALGPFCYTYA